MQSAYIAKLLELAEKDERICHLLADSGTIQDVYFKNNFPERVFNFGIAEQNAIGAAAGMALAGKIPFVFMQGCFMIYRALEFVRNDICAQNANVKLIGQGSGLSIAGLGYSHHTTEDIAILRPLPNICIFSPATPRQAQICTEILHGLEAPCYMRIGMDSEKEYFPETYRMPESGQDIMAEGKDAGLFVTGSIIEEVMEAAALLEADGIRLHVVNVARIKPFDETILMNMAEEVQRIFTVEEHQITGGLGGIVSESLSKKRMGTSLTRIGLENCFAKGYRPTQKQLRAENGLDACSIAKKVKEVLHAE